MQKLCRSYAESPAEILQKVLQDFSVRTVDELHKINKNDDNNASLYYRLVSSAIG